MIFNNRRNITIFSKESKFMKIMPNNKRENEGNWSHADYSAHVR